MMTDRQYNEFFQNRMDSFSSPVSDDLWKKIELNNNSKTNKKIRVAKYILLLFSLIIGVKTSDNLITPDAKQNTFTSYKIVGGKNDPDLSLGNKIAEEKNNDLAAVPTEQKQNNDQIRAENKKEKKTWLQEKIKDKNNKKLKDETNAGNTSSSSSFINENKEDSMADAAIKTKKKPALKQADSTADITVETHDKADRFSLFVYASPDANFSHVSAVNSSYQQQRNEEAKSQVSWSAGLRIKYHINEHWSGNIGVQYSRTNEKIRLANRTSQNHYSSLDIPLLAGYRIHKNKLQIDANAGIIVNIKSAYKGYISSADNQAVDIRKENVYKQNTSLSYYGGIQMIYRPANRISLFAEPYFRYQPQNIANAFQPFEEKVQKAGVLIGARYRLYK